MAKNKNKKTKQAPNQISPRQTTTAPQRPSLIGRFCPGCVQFVVADQPCPACGALPTPREGADDPLEFSVNISVLVCEACQRVMNLGTEACPSCGEPTDPNEPTNPRDGPINRAKLTALGDLLPAFREAADVPALDGQPAPAITDDQLLAYVTRHDILSPDRLVGRLKAIVRRVDFSDEAAIGSVETRRAFEDMLAQTRELRAIYDELVAVRAPEQFGTLHLALVSAYQAALDLHLVCADGLLAVTLEEAGRTQRASQAALDRLAVLGDSMSPEIQAADPTTIAQGQVDRRLGAFTGSPGRYEHAGRPDLAAVLVAGLGGRSDLASLGQTGADFFRPMMSVDPATFPAEVGVALYVLAAEVAASDDPLTLRRQTNVLLWLLNEAYRRNPLAMSDAAVAAADDTEEALVSLLNQADILRHLHTGNLAAEAIRQALVTSYQTLAEWTYRRLLNLALAAKFVLRGRPKPYAKIAVADLGTKRNWLTQPADPRYVPALFGLDTVTRNAGAHGDVETSGPKIRLVQRDRNDRTRITDVQELTDEEFVCRLEDLLLTCDALRLAGELFRVEHYDELPAAGQSTRRRMIAEVARVIVGYWGLVRATVDFDGQGCVTVDAEEDERASAREPRDYLAAAFTLATLFPESAAVQVRVHREGELRCRIEVPTAEVLAHRAREDDVATYSLLKTIYLSTFEPTEADGVERYRFELIRPAARLLVQDLAALQRLRQGLPATRTDYLAALDVLGRKVDVLADALRSVEPPADEVARRGRLLAGLHALRRGLRGHERLMRAGRWAAVGRASVDLQRGARFAVDLAASS